MREEMRNKFDSPNGKPKWITLHKQGEAMSKNLTALNGRTKWMAMRNRAKK